MKKVVVLCALVGVAVYAATAWSATSSTDPTVSRLVKDVATLKRMCSSQGKMMSRKRTGNCAAFQRAVKDAVKRARFLALLPYVGE